LRLAAHRPTVAAHHRPRNHRLGRLCRLRVSGGPSGVVVVNSRGGRQPAPPPRAPPPRAPGAPPQNPPRPPLPAPPADSPPPAPPRRPPPTPPPPPSPPPPPPPTQPPPADGAAAASSAAEAEKASPQTTLGSAAVGTGVGIRHRGGGRRLVDGLVAAPHRR